MRHLRRRIGLTRRRTATVAWATFVSITGCDNPPAAGTAAAAKVSNGVAETELTTVTLSPAAVTRLGIETVEVESTTVGATRELGGEIVVPPGQALTITAPVAGTVLAPASGAVPGPGTHVARGATILRLVALPPDRDLLRTQQDLAAAEARLKQAQSEADRVAALFAERVVSARENETAQAELATAKATRDAVAAQTSLISGNAPRDGRGLSPLTISAPDGGIVQAIRVAPGQSVAAGAPLAELVQLDRVWVRVPIYAGDASRIAKGVSVTVHGLAGPTAPPVIRATPIPAPPSADPTAASVDLFFQVNGAGLSPGERVGVTMPLAAARGRRSLVVPLAAIVHDMNGGTWVYERRDSVTFVRRRVEVERTAGTAAVLTRGPPPGTPVVVAGVAELFGTEFGGGK